MGKFIGIGAGAMVEKKNGQVEELGGLVQVEENRRKEHPFEVDGKEIISNRCKQAKPKLSRREDG